MTRDLYALFGNPVSQSLSPVMMNAAFTKLNMPARYAAFRVDHAADIRKRMDTRSLRIRGASVTIPHKVKVMDCLDGLTESAEAIGAVNTIIRADDRLTGDNTDWIGIVRALSEHMEIAGSTFLIVGAGGTARAALYGIITKGGIPSVTGRSAVKGEALTKEFGCDFLYPDDLPGVLADCLINTTPLGMKGYDDASPVPAGILERFTSVMDVIYNPPITKLLSDAAARGCTTISGVSMFVSQGAEQLRRWTGMKPPEELMKQVVMERLNT